MNEQELEILKFWRENQIFKQSLAKPSPQGEFVFYEGPPYANGQPGVHHLEARAFKDIMLRYKTMRGFRVRRRAGWDTHGLPIEMAVEKKLGLTSKKEIEEKIGIAKFVAEAKANVFFYKKEWEKFTERIGYWLDFEEAYLTMSPEYIESVWWILKQIDDKKLLYKDYKVLPWCPRCGTALSSHELAQGYVEVPDTAVYVKFKIVADERFFRVLGNPPDGRAGNPQTTQKPFVGSVYLLAWTTTPWTLPGNVALAVGKDIQYEIFATDDGYVIAHQQFGGRDDWPAPHNGAPKERGRQIAGEQLVGLEYEPLFNFPELRNDKSHRVYAADFVTTNEGTGIVHTAVMYGADDFALGTEVGLPKHHLVGEDGKFLTGTPWAGKFVKSADKDIITDLETRGLLFKQETITHTYPFCWRCKTPLIYYARDSWYIKMSAVRDELVAENQKINWEPSHLRDGRFGEWLREVKDWAVSRERYWGTPLPVWQSEAGKRIVIGSLEELKRYTKKSGNTYVVMRHGEAEHNVRGIIDSTNEEKWPLTALGREQVKTAAEKLRDKKITRLYSSPFQRARETTEIIADSLSISLHEIVYDDRLRELNFGDLHGKPFTEFLAYEEKHLKSYADPLPGGESYLEAKKRFGSFMYEIEAKLSGEQVLIVTHGIGPEVLEAIIRGADALESKQIIETLDPPIGEARSLEFTPLPHNENYELDLHRPFIDDLQLVDEEGTSLKRVTEVLDVWFDSGAMPFAQDHYPFDFAQGKPLAGQDLLYPADYISEAIDQTRGWFYTLLAIGVLVGRGAPYKNVISLGHLLDKAGKKMSKSVGNVVDPWAMIERYGVDALRYWMYTINPPGESKNFDERTVDEVVKKVFNPLLNVLQFYRLYVGDYKPRAAAPESSHLLDRWIITLLNQLLEKVTYHLDHYQIFEAARLFRDFIADLSQWYLRRSRDRFKSSDVLEREQAMATTHFVLVTLSKLLAPFTPFLAEALYQQLKSAADVTSVHLHDWPVTAVTTDESVLTDMNITRELVSAALEARAKAGIKVRQPLASLTLKDKRLAAKAQFRELIADEVNVKEILFDETVGGPVVLDITLTPGLVLEGQARDLIRAIQELRKEAKLQPVDKITLELGVDYQSVWEQFGSEIELTCGIVKTVPGVADALRLVV